MTFQDQVVELLHKYIDEYQEGFLQKAWETHEGFIGYGFFESYVAYCLMREYKPEITVDIGSACGFSSYPLNFACNRNKEGIVLSYELNIERCEKYRENMTRNDLKALVFSGKVEKNIYETLFIDGFTIDLLFIDADHSQSFAEWYLKELIPKTKTLLHVHDIAYLPNDGEAQAVLAWLKEHPEYEVIRCWELAYEGGDTQQKKSTDLASHFKFPPEDRGEANSSIWVKLE